MLAEAEANMSVFVSTQENLNSVRVFLPELFVVLIASPAGNSSFPGCIRAWPSWRAMMLLIASIVSEAGRLMSDRRRQVLGFLTGSADADIPHGPSSCSNLSERSNQSLSVCSK